MRGRARCGGAYGSVVMASAPVQGELARSLMRFLHHRRSPVCGRLLNQDPWRHCTHRTLSSRQEHFNWCRNRSFVTPSAPTGAIRLPPGMLG